MEVAKENKEMKVEYMTYYMELRRSEERGMEKGMEKGKAEGIALGEAKGAKETSISVARNLLSLGIPVDKIAQATLLSIEEIESLNEQA